MPAHLPAARALTLPLPLPPQELLNKKDMVGDCFNQLRLARQRTLNENAVVSRGPRPLCLCWPDHLGVSDGHLCTLETACPDVARPCCFRAAQVKPGRGGRPLGPTACASMDDEQDMNDTLGQLLMVMQLLDEEIGELVGLSGHLEFVGRGWFCTFEGWWWTGSPEVDHGVASRQLSAQAS